MSSRVDCASAPSESTASDCFIFPKEWKYKPIISPSQLIVSFFIPATPVRLLALTSKCDALRGDVKRATICTVMMRRSIFVLVLFLWVAAPVLACLPTATMTDAEMACCKKMAGDCDMGSGKHSCSQHKISATPTVATVAHSSQPDLLASAGTAADICDSLSPQYNSQTLLRSTSPSETSPPALKLILRI